MQNDFYTLENYKQLAQARKQGIISTSFLIAAKAIHLMPTLGKFDMFLLSMASFYIFPLVFVFYEYKSLKNISQISKTNVFKIYQNILFSLLLLFIAVIIVGFLGMPEAIYLLSLAFFAYAIISWIRINLALAKITQNRYFKLCIISMIVVYIVECVVVGVFVNQENALILNHMNQSLSLFISCVFRLIAWIKTDRLYQ